ncbi:MAG: glycosyltransferase family 4 protein [Candidatus Marinimicrobia bacterium]|jgi:glycosyltransferase involved in cell wall biosynthesis|nr:glycosyltransferase family 4 protein [Candidatus Neomarinimicrobiota bacterium]MBT7514391.1 glycosyltransferase family 4 protein [Candidatus Neomarinimicrobiota bacterium]
MDYQSNFNLFIFNTFLNVIWCQTIIIWFASIHAIPVIILNYIFNRRLIIIAGGFDVANEPKSSYGSMRGKSRTVLGKWILSRAHRVIAVSKSNKKEILFNANVNPDKVELIYNAILFNGKKVNSNKKKQILTVGEINKETFLRKGLDRFIQIATKMPDYQFYHIGKWTNNKGRLTDEMFKYVESISPPNIKYLGYVNTEVLRQYYLESKVYLQLSRHEAFGISVVEAMSYNCTPIVTNSYALPEIVGRNGFIVQNIDEAILKIKTVLESELFSIDHSLLSKFSIENRRDKFNQLI